jgi:hypothetical protein
MPPAIAVASGGHMASDQIISGINPPMVVFCLDDNDDERLARIMTRVAKSGKAWFGPTTWQGRNVYRMSISSHETNQADLDVALAAIKDAMD